MLIKDIMSQPIVSAPTSATLDAIARLMWEFDCGTIPVIDDAGHLAGIVTDRDVCMAAYTQGKPLAAIPVTTAMASPVIACHVGDAIETAEHLMRDNQIRRLPVLDSESRPVGVVAMNDLTRFAARAKKSGVDREIVQTLAGICQPRASAAKVQANNIVAA